MRSGSKIGIIDYGMGNLRSVSKAIEHLGGSVYVGSDLSILSRLEKLILPGVGAFGDAMAELKKRKLVPLIQNASREGKKILGICLGLQLFFERSAENPNVKGLSLWKGSVPRFTKTNQDLKIPHMGWNQVDLKRTSKITAKLKNHSYFYFVHSYYSKPADKSLIVGKTDYGISFPAVLASENIFAVQFHPEKSQKAGLQILKNFIELLC